MAPILNMSSLNNAANAHGVNGGATHVSNDKPYAVLPGNTQYAGPTTSAAALAGKDLMKIVSANNKPMSGGGRSRRHKRSCSSRRGSKRYSRGRSLRYRLKHKKTGKRAHRRGHSKRKGQRGGYTQYMSNTAFTLGQRLPGFALPSNQSALANPPPFMPYRNCPGGN